MQRTVRICTAITLAALGLALFARPAAATPLPATAGMIRNWAPEWMQDDHTYTQAEANDVAARHDVIVAFPSTFGPYIAGMRATNPTLRVLSYVNGMYTGNPTDYPDSYYAHDPSGNKIEWIPWGTWLLEPSNPAWRTQVGTNCANRAAEGGYDGCMLDNVGTTAVTFPDDKSGVPVDPATGQLYTQASYVNTVAALLADVRAAQPGLTLAGNGYGNGDLYDDPAGATSVLGDNLDAVMMEQFARSATQGVTTYRNEDVWKHEVDSIIHSQSRGAPLLAVAKLWVTATQAQREAWHKYALATFLMAQDGTSKFSYLGSKTDATSATGAHPWDQLDIGTPVESYGKVGGVYRRAFTKAQVVMNPTTSPVTVPLAGSFRDLNGTLWQGSFPLGANSGEVLLAYDTTSTPPPAAVTLPATDADADSARLNGVVNGFGTAGTTWYEWGTSTTYGITTTPTAVPAGYGDISRPFALTGQTYHYRAVIQTAQGTSYGVDQTFPYSGSQGSQITVSDAVVTEPVSGTRFMLFPVSLSEPSSDTVRFDFTTADGTATAPGDYTAKSGIFAFNPGETQANISVTVQGDGAAEGDENLSLVLSDPVSATFARSAATGLIKDPVSSVSVADLNLTERTSANPTTGAVQVTLNTPSALPVTVAYSTSNGTALSTGATPDFTATSGTVTVPAGASQAIIPVSVVADALDEADETFTVNLSNPTNGVVGDGSGKVTITDDDALPQVSINDVSVQEPKSGSRSAVFTVNLSAPSGRTVKVNYASVNGTATASSGDYTAKSGSISFPAGTTSKTISLAVLADTRVEATETFRVNLSLPAPPTATIQQGTGTASVVDA